MTPEQQQIKNRRDKPLRQAWAKSDSPAAKARNRFKAQKIAAKQRGHAPPPHEKDCPPRPADGKCQACSSNARPLVMDHDHVTGQFRGWICNRCNLGIGSLGDTVDGVKAALDYMAFNAPR